jgi:hypothetical protein
MRRWKQPCVWHVKANKDDKMNALIGPAILVVTLGFLLNTFMIEFFRHIRVKRMLSYKFRLIDAIASADDFVSILKGPDGEKFLTGLAEDSDAESVRTRSLRTLQTGVILIFGAGGLFGLNLLDSLESGDVFLALAIMVLSLGVGFCVSAWMAWRLSQFRQDSLDET